MEKTAAFNNAVLELNERIRIITAIALSLKSCTDTTILSPL